MADFYTDIEGLNTADLYRRLPNIESRRSGKVCMAGGWYWDLASNDYLGLAQNNVLLAKVASEVPKLGMGSTGSRLLSGDHDVFHALELAVSRLKSKESALLFNSGYVANLGTMQALLGPKDVVFLDRYVHASVLDGVRLSGARFFRYRHGDMAHLECLLGRHRQGFRRAMIVTESVFSMDGDISDFAPIVGLKDRFDTLLCVDEAHATGIMGANGAGVLADQQVLDGVDLVVGTFGKALGGSGAFVATSEVLKSMLINYSRSFIYSTMLPPIVAKWNLLAVDRLSQLSDQREKVLALSAQLRCRLTELGWTVLGESQIVPVVVGESASALVLRDKLLEAGIYVAAVRPPTVPKGEARLRFSFTPYITDAVVDTIVAVLGPMEKQ